MNTVALLLKKKKIKKLYHSAKDQKGGSSPHGQGLCNMPGENPSNATWMQGSQHLRGSKI